jgi:hypothetical protein
MSALIHALPIIGILLGGFLFTGSIAWMLAANRSANEEFEQTLRRYVLPRHLSDDQISTVADYLKGFDSQTALILVPKGDSEAGSYASDFYKALQQGGWTVTMRPCVDIAERLNLSQERLNAIDANTWCENLPEGISTYFRQTQNSSQTNDPKHPKPDQLLSQALQKARVRISGSGGGSGINTTENLFVIRIGARRMDDGDLIGEKLRRERARKVLEGNDEGGFF